MFAVLVCVFFSIPAHAYHFFEAANGGCRWAAIGPGNVDFVVDGSSTMAIGDALLTEVEEARSAWNDIGTAMDVLGDFTSGAVDFDDTNFGTAWGVGTTTGASDGQNEVVLDETGDILRNVFALDPARINGFGPSMQVVSGGTCTIVDAFNLLNGTRTNFDRRSTTVHEFGHIQGLAHSSVGEFNSRNASAGSGGTASPGAYLQVININDVPTMHPFSTGTGSSRRSPERDDLAGLSELYPEADFFTTTGSIQGVVTRCSDDTPLSGVNVRAVNQADRSIQVTRYADFDSNGVGRYVINGLTPGTYNLVVEPMGYNRFTAGRMAIQTAVDSGFPIEYYGPTADDENNCTEDVPDSPADVNVIAGATVIDFDVRVQDGTDLAFVVDDTGSMGNEIAAVRDILNNFIDVLDALAGLPFVEFPEVTIVTFKDNVTLRTISDDADELRAVVNSLTASGGGDCPESSNAALLEASRILRDGGVAILFTDADSRPDGPTREAVLEQYRARSQTQSALVSATCSEGFRQGDAAGQMRAPTYQSAEGGVTLDGAASVQAPNSSGNGDTFEEFDEPPSLGFEDGVVTFSQIASETGGIFVTLPRPTGGSLTTAYVNIGTNISISSVVPAIGLVTPGAGPAGATLSIELTGSNTNWNASSELTVPGSGITVNSFTVVSPTRIDAEITISGTQLPGFLDVEVATNLGGGEIETATGIGAFEVTSPTGAAQLTSVSPFRASPGTTLDVQIDGLGTAFDDTSMVDITRNGLAAGITTNSVTALSPTRIVANITIADDAEIALRDVTVDGITRVQGFLVTSSPADIARVVSVTPSQLGQGSAGVMLAIVGENTNFDDTSVVSFSGTGISVDAVTTNSETELIASVTVTADATLGFRDVFVTTGEETAVLLNGLQVTAPTEFEPRVVLEMVRDTVAGLLGGDRDVDKKLEKALEKLDKALDDRNWESDSRLTKKGKKVFDETKSVVKELEKAIEEALDDDDDVDASLVDTVTGAIDDIVQAVRELAVIALSDAIAADGDSDEIDKSIRELEKGDEDLDDGKPDKAIGHYKKAWENARKAID